MDETWGTAAEDRRDQVPIGIHAAHGWAPEGQAPFGSERADFSRLAEGDDTTT